MPIPKSIRTSLLLLALLILSGVSVCAQTIPLTGYGEKRSAGKSATGATKGDLMKSSGMVDARTLPIEKGMKYDDTGLKDMRDAMRERDWGNEDTAWERAAEADTKGAYERYIGMYPYGAHRSAADDRLVALQVEEMMRGSHSRLPQMTHVEVDDESPVSIIEVTNHTDYPLTVLYSGTDTRSVVISPSRTHIVTLKNGDYKIAASVPSPQVRPYAGGETLTGGRYEVGYYIVSH